MTTERDAERSVDPAPTWKVTFHPTPADVPKVIFIGDSVTAGFGYCGTEGGANSADINCRPNDSMADNWDRENGLKACAPSEAVKPVNDGARTTTAWEPRGPPAPGSLTRTRRTSPTRT